MALGDATDGTKMRDRRSIQVQLKKDNTSKDKNKSEYDLLLFSPLHNNAKNGKNKKIHLKCILDTQPRRDIIDHGFIKANVSQGDRKITIRQELDAWVKYPIHSHVTDQPNSIGGA